MPPRDHLSPVRRRVLRALVSGAGVGGFAGCLDAIDGDEPRTNASDSSDGSATAESGDDDESNESDESIADVHDEYETTTVRVTSPDGDELGVVTAAVADTTELQVLGLSETDELPADRGMLFVYETVDDRTFAMPEMSFGIDIVYADGDGVITSVHNAPEPEPGEDGSEQRYPGRGQYVLEVGYGWTAERGIEDGDVLEFDL